MGTHRIVFKRKKTVTAKMLTLKVVPSPAAKIPAGRRPLPAGLRRDIGKANALANAAAAAMAKSAFELIVRREMKPQVAAALLGVSPVDARELSELYEDYLDNRIASKRIREKSVDYSSVRKSLGL